MYSQKHLENFMENFFDSQKKALDSWSNMMMPSDKKSDSSEDTSPLNMFNQWNKFNENFFESIMNYSKDNPVYDTYTKMYSGINSYSTLFEIWKDMQNKFTNSSTFNPNSFMDLWKNQYNELIKNTFSPALPQKFQKIFKDSLEIYNSHIENSTSFFRPWTENYMTLNDLYTKSIMGDASSFVEWTKLYKDNYEKSFGKFFDMPTFGLNRNNFEVNLKSMESYINYLTTSSEFSSTLYKVAYETMENILNESYELMKESNETKSFKEFYEFWWKKNEEAYTKLFSTDDFSKLLAHVVDSSMNFKKDFDQLLEQQFSFLPFPLKSDLNSLYKTVYDLKKQVRELSKKID